jgi:hypothetical protein
MGKSLKRWWAGTGLNRRHQDFQISPSIPASFVISLSCACLLRPMRDYEERFVAFLDILGFSNLIEESRPPARRISVEQIARH